MLLRDARHRQGFPGVRALDGVDLQVRAGEVHCLLGQNGAGKSTLIKVLAGAHQSTRARSSGRRARPSLASPVAALKQGIATIYQELDLVDWLSVAENIFLGHELATAGFSQRAPRPRRPARCWSGWAIRRHLAAPRGRHAVRGRQADRLAWPGRCPATPG